MSFGIWGTQTDWTGAPLISTVEAGRTIAPGYNGVFYRFFGPDPIWFDTSAVLRFGSRANDWDSTIYAYVEPRSPPSRLMPEAWLLASPFPCRTKGDFDRRE